MMSVRIASLLYLVALVGLCLHAYRRGWTWRRLFGATAPAIVLFRILVFWYLLSCGLLGRWWDSPVLEPVALFPEWMIYEAFQGVMGTAIVGSLLVAVGSCLWAALLSLFVHGMHRLFPSPSSMRVGTSVANPCTPPPPC